MNRWLIGLSIIAGVAIAACGENPSAVSELSEPIPDPTTGETAAPSSDASADTASADTSPSSDQASEPSSEAFQTLPMGSFVSGEHPTQGAVSIIEENGQRYVEFANDFQTDSGPDLFVILHQSDDVIGSTPPPAHPIEEGDYVTLAPLQTVSGSQRYLIPETVNLEDYQSVAIWCQQFNATFGAASLDS
ncbi:MAG TPA: DM13 domain-containing protein [Elainellaceae cyanobacterium]